MKKNLCLWSKRVKKAMIDGNISRQMLADGIGRAPEYVSSVCCQRVRSMPTEKLISDFLNIEDDGKDVYD